MKQKYQDFCQLRIQALRLAMVELRGHPDLKDIAWYIIDRADRKTGEVKLTDEQIARFCKLTRNAVANRVNKLQRLSTFFDIERGGAGRTTTYRVSAEAISRIEEEWRTRALSKAISLDQVGLDKVNNAKSIKSAVRRASSRLGDTPIYNKKKKEEGRAPALVLNNLPFYLYQKSSDRFRLSNLETALREFGFRPGSPVYEMLIPVGDVFYAPSFFPDINSNKTKLYNAIRELQVAAES